MYSALRRRSWAVETLHLLQDYLTESFRLIQSFDGMHPKHVSFLVELSVELPFVVFSVAVLGSVVRSIRRKSPGFTSDFFFFYSIQGVVELSSYTLVRSRKGIELRESLRNFGSFLASIIRTGFPAKSRIVPKFTLRNGLCAMRSTDGISHFLGSAETI